MIFNLLQKYVSVFSSFVNTFLIISLLDLDYLGLYAFLTAGANIFAVLIPVGLRSVYLREIVKDRDYLQEQKNFTVLVEIVPKVTAVVFSATFIGAAILFNLSTIDAASIAVIGCMLASAQLTSQKLRSHGLNSLSQVVLNFRPIVFMFLLLGIWLTDKQLLEENFLTAIIASFVIPSILAYLFWLIKFNDLVFSSVKLSAVSNRARSIVSELPGLLMLAFGQKAIARTDIIMVTVLLDLDAAGIFRACTQIVTVANSSLYPLRSRYMKKYSRLLDQQRLDHAAKISRQVARPGVALYTVILTAAIVVIYQLEFLDDIKYRHEFILSLGILALTGLIKAGIPMVENYVVYRNKANTGGVMLLGVVIVNLLMHIMLIPLVGLPGACLTTLMSVLSWRFIVRRFI